MNKVEVLISGTPYTVTGDESKEYLMNLAAYVNEETAKFYKEDVVSKDKSHVLAALNIADNYFKSKRDLENMQKEIETLKIDIQKLNGEIRAKQTEIEQKEKNIEHLESNKTIEEYKEKIETLTENYEKKLKKKDEALEEAIKITEETFEKFYNLQLRIAQYETGTKKVLRERYKENKDSKNSNIKQMELSLPKKDETSVIGKTTTSTNTATDLKK